MTKKFSTWLQEQEMSATAAGSAMKAAATQMGSRGATGLHNLMQQVVTVVQNGSPSVVNKIVSSLQSGINGADLDDETKQQLLGQLAKEKQQLLSMRTKGNTNVQSQAQSVAQANGVSVPTAPTGQFTQPLVANPQ